MIGLMHLSSSRMCPPLPLRAAKLAQFWAWSEAVFTGAVEETAGHQNRP